MAENRVYEIFNSVLKNKLNKHATEQSEKLSDLNKKNAIKVVVTCTRCGVLVPSLSTTPELHSESLFQFKNYFSTVFDKTCTQPVVRKDKDKDINFRFQSASNNV